MRKAVGGKRRDIKWGITEQLENPDFVGDICLLSHTFSKMETKLKDLENEGKTVGLKINCGKTKSLRIYTWIDKKFELDKPEIEEVLRKYVDKHGCNRRRSKGMDSKGKCSFYSVVSSMES
jgi:hypothetical protein